MTSTLSTLPPKSPVDTGQTRTTNGTSKVHPKASAPADTGQTNGTNGTVPPAPPTAHPSAPVDTGQTRTDMEHQQFPLLCQHFLLKLKLVK